MRTVYCSFTKSLLGKIVCLQDQDFKLMDWNWNKLTVVDLVTSLNLDMSFSEGNQCSYLEHAEYIFVRKVFKSSLVTRAMK